MKKRIVSLLSLLLAFVMCFALIACGNDDGKGTGSSGGNGGGGNGGGNGGNGGGGSGAGEQVTVEQMLPKALASFDNLVEEDGFKGDYAYAMSSNKGGDTGEGKIERRYNTVKIGYGDDAYAYYNVENGYVYKQTDDGVIGMGLPTSIDIADYLTFLMGSAEEEPEDIVLQPRSEIELPDIATGGLGPDIAAEQFAKLAEHFTYDGENKKLVGTFDEKSEVNACLRMLYKNKSNGIYYLIDDAIKYTTNNRYSLVYIFTTVSFTLKASVESPLGEFFEMLEAMYGIDVIETLKDYVELTEEQEQAIQSRTVGEAATALSDYMAANITPVITAFANASGEFDKDQLKGLAVGAINAMLFAPVDSADDAEEKINALMVAVESALKIVTVNRIVNTIDNPNLSFMVRNSVYLEKCDCTLTFTFDENDNVVKYELASRLSHDYTGNDAGETVFANNNLEFSASLTVTDWLTSPEEYALSAETVFAAKLVYGELDGEGVVIDLDSKGKSVSVQNAVFAYVTEELVEVDTEDGLSFDSQTGCLNVSAALAAELKEKADEMRVVMIVLPEAELAVYVVFPPEDGLELMDYAKTVGSILKELVGEEEEVPAA